MPEKNLQMIEDLQLPGDTCLKLDVSLRISASLTLIEAKYYDALEVNLENELVRVIFKGKSTP